VERVRRGAETVGIKRTFNVRDVPYACFDAKAGSYEATCE